MSNHPIPIPRCLRNIQLPIFKFVNTKAELKNPIKMDVVFNSHREHSSLDLYVTDTLTLAISNLIRQNCQSFVAKDNFTQPEGMVYIPFEKVLYDQSKLVYRYVENRRLATETGCPVISLKGIAPLKDMNKWTTGALISTARAVSSLEYHSDSTEGQALYLPNRHKGLTVNLDLEDQVIETYENFYQSHTYFTVYKLKFGVTGFENVQRVYFEQNTKL
jgi:hypothetical protein